jgi:integrase
VREGKKRRNSLSADELHRFLEAAKQHTPQWYPFFYALAFTGLRFGELTNLRWRDLDEKAGVIVVEAAQWKGQEGETKTGEDRYPPLFPELLTILRDHKTAQLKARKKKAKREQVTQWDALTISDDDLIFVAPRSNKHMHNTAPRKALLACLEAAGIDRRFTVHGSRHTFNNLLRRSTKDLTLVRSMMGHSEGDGKITDRYSDVGNEEKRAAVTGLVLLVGGAGKGAT